MIPLAGSELLKTPTGFRVGSGRGTGPTGRRSPRSCVGSSPGECSILWTRTSPAARGGARSTRTCCATRSRRSCSWSTAAVRRGRPSSAGSTFFNAPSAQTWYGAHNASVVAGYLAHSTLAALEPPAERFFMNVVLVRVLYAHALVLDGDLALGRLAFLARLIGHPRARGPQALLSMKDVLPDRYPIADCRNTGAHRRREPDRQVDGLRGDQRAGRRAVRRRPPAR